jgi:hypothetical protein
LCRAAVQMPGYVPRFDGKEIGDTFDKHAQMGMDMSVKKLLMLKDAGAKTKTKPRRKHKTKPNSLMMIIE